MYYRFVALYLFVVNPRHHISDCTETIGVPSLFPLFHIYYYHRMMKGVLLFVLACFVLADGILLFVCYHFLDCGSFTCNCDEESSMLFSFFFQCREYCFLWCGKWRRQNSEDSGENCCLLRWGKVRRRPYLWTSFFFFFSPWFNKWKLFFEMGLLFIATSIYNRTLTSNVVKFTGDKGISELGCTGVSTGNSIDLVKEEE